MNWEWNKVARQEVAVGSSSWGSKGIPNFFRSRKGTLRVSFPRICFFSVFSFGSITSRVRLSEGIGSGGGDGRRGVSTPCFFSFSKARREFWKREWKSWVSLALRQTRHWLNSSCLFPAIFFWICLFDLWSMSPIVDSIWNTSGRFNQRVISNHPLEISIVMVLPTHLIDHYHLFFLFWG